jgi:uncharacterized repeat protein (TIGR03803 family)
MSETILHSFNSADGLYPSDSLVYQNGVFYGITTDGGINENGVLYEFDLSSGILTALHSFTGLGTDGAYPYGSPVYQDGILYGTTYAGGLEYNGSLYSYDLSLNSYTSLYSFTDTIGVDGASPISAVVYQNGILYGTTSRGGSSIGEGGTLFAFDLSSGILTTLHFFAGIGGEEGSFANSSVVYQDGILYGTTRYGGFDTDSGTLFAFDLTSGILTTLHFLTGVGTNGSYPDASVIYQNGLLYGTTSEGGLNNGGTLFSYDLSSNTFTSLFFFSENGTDGFAPSSSVLYHDGTLYGTCSYKTDFFGFGTLFAYNLSSGILTTLHSFAGTPTDGLYPYGSVIYLNGLLYGTTSEGGSFGDYGTIYSFDLSTIPISGVCFPAGTPISCDQGNIPIDRINPLKHTINNQTITAITRTISQDNYLICFEQHALSRDCPSQRTVMSKNHKILYRGKMTEAYQFLKHSKQVRRVKYNQQILYNVLMEKHDTICVNNIVCETLHPNNIVARLHNSRLKQKEKNEIIRHLNKSIEKKDRISYAGVAKRINNR